MGKLEDNRILTRIDSYRKKMPKKRTGRHFYTELTDEQIGKLLWDIRKNSVRWHPETAAAMELAPCVILRPNKLCGTRWEEIDFDAGEWRLPPKG